MKTFALLVLISATILGVTAYAQEPSGAVNYSPAINDTSSVIRAHAISKPEPAKVAARVSFGEDAVPATKIGTIAPIQAEATTIDVIGIYPSGDESYKSAFSVVGLPRG